MRFALPVRLGDEAARRMGDQAQELADRLRVEGADHCSFARMLRRPIWYRPGRDESVCPVRRRSCRRRPFAARQQVWVPRVAGQENRDAPAPCGGGTGRSRWQSTKPSDTTPTTCSGCDGRSRCCRSPGGSRSCSSGAPSPRSRTSTCTRSTRRSAARPDAGPTPRTPTTRSRWRGPSWPTPPPGTWSGATPAPRRGLRARRRGAGGDVPRLLTRPPAAIAGPRRSPIGHARLSELSIRRSAVPCPPPVACDRGRGSRSS